MLRGFHRRIRPRLTAQRVRVLVEATGLEPVTLCLNFVILGFASNEVRRTAIVRNAPRFSPPHPSAPYCAEGAGIGGSYRARTCDPLLELRDSRLRLE